MFQRPDIVVTNFHVVENAIPKNTEIVAQNTEEKERQVGKILGHSQEHDFVILQVAKPFPKSMGALEPDSIQPIRGTEVVFAGYPHGTPPLLVNKAWISGSLNKGEFIIGANINSGNSGGPVVSRETGRLLGIASARRFIGEQALKQMTAEQDKLIAYLESAAGRSVSAVIQGINFGEFIRLMAESLKLLKETTIQNANTGIGVVKAIGPVIEQYKELNL